MDNRTLALADPASGAAVPPPRRRRQNPSPQLYAPQVLRIRGLLPLARSVVAGASLRQWRLPSPARKRGRPRVSSAAAVSVIASRARLRLAKWPTRAGAGGLPAGRVKKLGGDPFRLLSLGLVRRGPRAGLLTGRDGALTSSVPSAWRKADPAADWSFPAAFHGSVVGSKAHVRLDRVAHPPLFFRLWPANKHALPFASPSLGLGRALLVLPIAVVRAAGARPRGHPGNEVGRFSGPLIGAPPIIPVDRKWQPLAHVRPLVCWPLRYPARPISESFVAAAKRYDGLHTDYRRGGDAVLLQVTLRFCAIVIVALVANAVGRPDLRLSPTRVLARYLPVEQAL